MVAWRRPSAKRDHSNQSVGNISTLWRRARRGVAAGPLT